MSEEKKGSGCPFHRLGWFSNSAAAGKSAPNHGGETAETDQSEDLKPSDATQKEKQGLQNKKVEVKS